MAEEVKKAPRPVDPNSAKYKLGKIAADAFVDAIEAKKNGIPVAWVSSNFPVEIPETLGIATILTTIGTINNFNAVWLMTQGGPLGSTEIMFTYAYRRAFSAHNFGQAAAISVIMFIIIALCTFVYTKLIGEEED